MVRYISAVTLLVIFSAPVDAQIAFDAASSGEVNNGTSVSYNHTVSGTSTLLVVGVHTLTGTDVVNMVTYNGAALTLIDKILIVGAERWVYQYALQNAPQGSHVLSVTTTTAVGFAVVSASYTGVDGLPVDNSTKQWTIVGDSPTSSTTTLTPNTSNTWTILVGAATSAPIGSGSGSTIRAKSGQFTTGPPFDRLAIFDSNGPINPAAATSMTITGNSSYAEIATVMVSYAAAETTGGQLPRLYSNSLTYLGGFRVPTICDAGDLRYGGGAIAFNPSGNGGAGSLFISSYAMKVAEISLPILVNSATVTNLNTATCVTPFVEPTEGVKTQGNVGTDSSAQAHPTGMVVADGKLWINNGVYYDAGGEQALSVMSRPLNLATTGQVKGLYGLTSSQPGFLPSMTSTQITAISSDWTTAMGGNLFLSKFNKPIITSESYGPNAIVSDTATLSGPAQTTYTANATPLFYPGSHSLSGDSGGVTGQTYTWFSHAHDTGSLVQPAGTRSLLVFQVAGATRGTSAGGYGYGYGCGCSQWVQPGSATCPGTSQTCPPDGYYYDPERSGDKGTHGYPYVYQIVAFDMEHLAAVKNGIGNPWDILPYTSWEFTFPISPGLNAKTRLSNATYDSVNNKIYIAQLQCCDADGLDPKPIIHVFQVIP